MSVSKLSATRKAHGGHGRSRRRSLVEVWVYAGKTFGAVNIDPARKAEEALPCGVCVMGAPLGWARHPLSVAWAGEGSQGQCSVPRRFPNVTERKWWEARIETLFIDSVLLTALLVHVVPNRYLIFFFKGFQPTHPPTHQGLGNREVGTSSHAHDDLRSLPLAMLPSGPALPELCASLDKTHRRVTLPPSTTQRSAVPFMVPRCLFFTYVFQGQRVIK